MAASTSPSSTSNAAADSTHHLIKRIRSHEIAIVELNNLSSSRHYRGWRVYNRITWQYLGVTTRVTSFLRRRNENHEVVSHRWLNPRGPNGFGMLNELGIFLLNCSG
ncbi:uncharacterized protein LOC114307476 isoform X1 [Camellia sinensis]|uniref:uncharacterized protein LOC114307476 isoform X1 n=1 Tax=Camellia sinensis TaxID=4442 RepID=UPI0010362029|nr:uncharacterized protein LOC114307476 isoform X1 [Camellia sinensis]